MRIFKRLLFTGIILSFSLILLDASASRQSLLDLPVDLIINIVTFCDYEEALYLVKCNKRILEIICRSQNAFCYDGEDILTDLMTLKGHIRTFGLRSNPLDHVLAARNFWHILAQCDEPMTLRGLARLFPFILRRAVELSTQETGIENQFPLRPRTFKLVRLLGQVDGDKIVDVLSTLDQTLINFMNSSVALCGDVSFEIGWKLAGSPTNLPRIRQSLILLDYSQNFIKGILWRLFDREDLESIEQLLLTDLRNRLSYIVAESLKYAIRDISANLVLSLKSFFRVLQDYPIEPFWLEVFEGFANPRLTMEMDSRRVKPEAKHSAIIIGSLLTGKYRLLGIELENYWILYGGDRGISDDLQRALKRWIRIIPVSEISAALEATRDCFPFRFLLVTSIERIAKWIQVSELLIERLGIGMIWDIIRRHPVAQDWISLLWREARLTRYLRALIQNLVKVSMLMGYMFTGTDIMGILEIVAKLEGICLACLTPREMIDTLFGLFDLQTDNQVVNDKLREAVSGILTRRNPEFLAVSLTPPTWHLSELSSILPPTRLIRLPESTNINYRILLEALGTWGWQVKHKLDEDILRYYTVLAVNTVVRRSVFADVVVYELADFTQRAHGLDDSANIFINGAPILHPALNLLRITENHQELTEAPETAIVSHQSNPSTQEMMTALRTFAASIFELHFRSNENFQHYYRSALFCPRILTFLTESYRIYRRISSPATISEREHLIGFARFLDYPLNRHEDLDSAVKIFRFIRILTELDEGLKVIAGIRE